MATDPKAPETDRQAAQRELLEALAEAARSVPDSEELREMSEMSDDDLLAAVTEKTRGL